MRKVFILLALCALVVLGSAKPHGHDGKRDHGKKGRGKKHGGDHHRGPHGGHSGSHRGSKGKKGCPCKRAANSYKRCEPLIKQGKCMFIKAQKGGICIPPHHPRPPHHGPRHEPPRPPHHGSPPPPPHDWCFEKAEGDEAKCKPLVDAKKCVWLSNGKEGKCVLPRKHGHGPPHHPPGKGPHKKPEGKDWCWEQAKEDEAKCKPLVEAKKCEWLSFGREGKCVLPHKKKPKGKDWCWEQAKDDEAKCKPLVEAKKCVWLAFGKEGKCVLPQKKPDALVSKDDDDFSVDAVRPMEKDDEAYFIQKMMEEDRDKEGKHGRHHGCPWCRVLWKAGFFVLGLLTAWVGSCMRDRCCPNCCRCSKRRIPHASTSVVLPAVVVGMDDSTRKSQPVIPDSA